MWGRRAVSGLVGRLGDRVKRTAQRWRAEARTPARSAEQLSSEQRIRLAEELGVSTRLPERPPDPASAPEPQAPEAGPGPEEPSTPTGSADEPFFIGLADLNDLDPPAPRGALMLAPDHDGPIHAVAERIDDGPSGPADEPADPATERAHERPPTVFDEGEEHHVVQIPEPERRPAPDPDPEPDPFDRFGDGFM
jgi:hypothetical protein